MGAYVDFGVELNIQFHAMKKYLLLFVLNAAALSSLQSQPGSLDQSFALQGNYIFRPNHETVCAESILDSEGKLMLSGWMQPQDDLNRYPLLARLDADGMPDVTFGNLGYIDLMGIPQFEEFAYFGTIAQQSNGKYVALAYNNYDGHQLVRINSDGVIDNTFSSTPFMLHRAGYYRSMIDSQDRLVVSCFYFPDDNVYQYYGNMAVIRFSPDGALDLSFGSGGFVMLGNLENDERCYDVALDASDNIYVAGYWSLSPGNGTSAARIYALDTDGELRSDFAAGGVLDVLEPGVYNTFSGLDVQDDGIIVVSGARYNPQTFIQQGMLAKLSSTGSPIFSFGTNGVYLSDDTDAEFRYVTVLSDGNIAVAARVNNADFARDARVSIITADGENLASFGAQGNSALFDVGMGDESPLDILQDEEGRIIMAGSGFAVVENEALGIQYGSKGFVNRYMYEATAGLPIDGNSELVIYPNPTSDVLYIKGQGVQSYTIIDAHGAKVSSGICERNEIPLQHLSSGMYVLAFSDRQYRFLVERE
jgi:uncharacterized delta-60 repeat protein